MNRYEEYKGQLSEKTDLLYTRLSDNRSEKYNLLNENIDLGDRIDNLNEQIEELTEIEKIINEYGTPEKINQRANAKIGTVIISLVIGVLSGTVSGILRSSNDLTNKIFRGIFIGSTFGTLVLSVQRLIENRGNRYYYKRVVNENNLEDVRFKLNRKVKKRKKLEDTLERNNFRIIKLNEKIKILEESIDDFNNLKYRVDVLLNNALDYAASVHGYYIHSKHPKYYENTINQHFKEDGEIKNIMKRERKLENDN